LTFSDYYRNIGRPLEARLPFFDLAKRQPRRPPPNAHTEIVHASATDTLTDHVGGMGVISAALVVWQPIDMRIDYLL